MEKSKQRKQIPYISLASMALLVAFSACSSQNNTQNIKPLPFKSAIISYQLKGNMEGSETKYFKGDMAVHETHAQNTRLDENNNPVTEAINTLVIDTGDTLYHIDLDKKTGTKSSNDIYKNLKDLSPEQRINYLNRILVGTQEQEVPQPSGQKTIAGQTCDVYSTGPNNEVCVWNTIPLSSSLTLSALNISNSMEASSIEIDAEIADKVFTVPSEITIEEYNN